MLDAELITLLLAVLPGLVVAELLDALPVCEEREPLEHVSQTLLYTFLNRAT